MSVLDRSELEASPLADLHAIADQLGLDGFRRLRKADLIDAILGEPAKDANGSGAGGSSADRGADGDRSGDGDDDGDGDGESERGSASRSRGSGAAGGARKRRTPRLRRGAKASSEDGESEGEDSTRGESSGSAPASSPEAPVSSRRGRGAGAREGGDGGGRGAAQPNGRSGGSSKPGAGDGARSAEGVVELLGNGSAFLRVDPPEPSDDDVYISAAQVRRCELVSGDKVTGPVRTPRRSERYPSLVRIDTINGASADSVAESAHYDDLPVAYPSERLALNAGDPTLDAIEWLTPLGRGSRATIVGPSRSGKTETLKRLLGALKDSGLEVTVVLAGARPEEIAEWREGGEDATAPVAALSFATSADAQSQAVERAIEAAKRIATRGGDVLVLIDGLDGMHPPAARKALAAARNLRDGGSLTVIATAARPLGGETTVIALDPALADSGLPLLDLAASGTLKPELLVGEDGAKAIAKARAEARN
ncbi:MAG TPA: Rho termination factor N-terminal domain-containing protein [Solirubrobacteraceae bacterium]|jgi:transcription termination factor Rho